MTSPPPGSIVVGIDGSPGADQALDWAVRQASLERRALTVVHAVQLVSAPVVGLPGIEIRRVLGDLEDAGRALLGDATTRAALLDPDLVVHTVLTVADPRSSLLDLAPTATMVVVGSRGRGPVASLLLGSVSVAVSAHAACPVVVVRHPTLAPRGAGVLVDVDGSDAALPALEFAYATASFRSLPLTAVLVFWDTAHGAAGEPVPADEPGLEDLRALLAESVAGLAEKHPDVETRTMLVRGFHDRELVRASHDMDLVVVASRPRGRLVDLLHGSITPTVVESAACDVAVVPASSTSAPH